MDIHARSENGIDILEFDGRFDAYEVPAMTQWLAANPDARNMVINLSGVGFVDSSGLATLVKCLKRCRQNEGELYLCNLQQAVQIIFELTQLDKAFTIFADQKTALQNFAKKDEGN